MCSELRWRQQLPALPASLRLLSGSVRAAAPGRLGAPCGPPEDTPQRIADGTDGDPRARFALRGFQVRSRWARQVCLRGMLPP